MDSVRALILQWEVMTLVSDSQLGDRPNRRVAGGAQRKWDTQIKKAFRIASVQERN